MKILPCAGSWLAMGKKIETAGGWPAGRGSAKVSMGARIRTQRRLGTDSLNLNSAATGASPASLGPTTLMQYEFAMAAGIRPRRLTAFESSLHD